MFWLEEDTVKPTPEASQFTAPVIEFAEVSAVVK